MKTIIAPTDFSDASLNAVNYAADMACVTGCDLLLLYVYELPVVIGDVPMPIYGTDINEDYGQKKMDTLRDNILFRTKDRIKVITKIEQGAIRATIEECCSAVNPYAVVMGPETAGSIGQLAGAAITNSAIKDLHWPVIIVPDTAHFANIKKIGLACDFKNVVDTVPVEEIKSIIKEFNATLHVMHVHEKAEASYNNETVEESGWLQEMLYELHPVYHLLNNKNIEEGIEQFADNNKLDMLIVIPKKHGLLHQLFLKSNSKQLVLHSHVPVMTVHEQNLQA